MRAVSTDPTNRDVAEALRLHGLGQLLQGAPASAQLSSVPYERIPIDIFGGDTLTPEYAAKNPATPPGAGARGRHVRDRVERDPLLPRPRNRVPPGGAPVRGRGRPLADLRADGRDDDHGRPALPASDRPPEAGRPRGGPQTRGRRGGARLPRAAPGRPRLSGRRAIHNCGHRRLRVRARRRRGRPTSTAIRPSGPGSSASRPSPPSWTTSSPTRRTRGRAREARSTADGRLARLGLVPRVVQLRGDLPVPSDRRGDGRPLDVRDLPRRALVANPGRTRERSRSGRAGRRARVPLQRRRGGLAVELRPLRGRARRRRTARGARRGSSRATGPVLRSS